MLYIFEGMDASGKTYLINWLEQKLKEKSIPVHVIKKIAFTDTSETDAFSDLLKYQISLYNKEVRHLTFLARMISLIEGIEREEKEKPNQVLLLDRGFLSVIAYALNENIKTSAEFDFLVSQYIYSSIKPIQTFLFNFPYNKDLLNNRQNTEYYQKFNGSKLYDIYNTLYNQYKTNQNIILYPESTYEEFNKRNEVILNIIVNNYNNKGE